MKRHLMTLAFSAVVGSLVLVGNAEACHKKKAVCAAPAPVCAPAPVVCEAPVVAACPAPAKKCGLGHGFKNPLKGIKLGHGHKKAAVCEPAPAPCGEVVYSAPAPSAQYFAAPVYAAPQASGQN